MSPGCKQDRHPLVERESRSAHPPLSPNGNGLLQARSAMESVCALDSGMLRLEDPTGLFPSLSLSASHLHQAIACMMRCTGSSDQLHAPSRFIAAKKR